MELFRQAYWSGLPFPTQGIFPTYELKPHLLHLLYWQVDFLPLCHLGNPDYVCVCVYILISNSLVDLLSCGCLQGRDAYLMQTILLPHLAATLLLNLLSSFSLRQDSPLPNESSLF